MKKRFSSLTLFGLTAALLALMGVVTALAAPAATHGPAHVNGTVTLDRSFYTNKAGEDGAKVKIKVTDADFNVASDDLAFTTTVTADAGLAGQFVQLLAADRVTKITNAVGTPVVSVVGGTRAGAFASTKANFAYTNGALGRGTLSTDGSAGVATGDVVQIIFKTGVQNTVKVKVTSSSDATGFFVDATEVDSSGNPSVDSNVFQATVTLITGASDPATSKLQAQDGNDVIAAFTDTPAVGSAFLRSSTASKVEITGPTFSSLLPATKTSTKETKPTFSGTITDVGSGIKLNTVLLKIGATTVVPTFVGSPADGALSVSFTFQPTTALGGVQDWQIEAADVAGNLSKSDSDASTTAADKHKLTIDTTAPVMGSAETGVFWDTSKATPVEGTGKATSLVVRFDEDLDSTTVTADDFTVAGVKPADAVVFSGSKKNVFITVATALGADAKPEVKIASGGSIKDVAGNEVTSSATAVKAADKIKPTLTAVPSKTLLKKDEESVISISANEPILGAPKVEIKNVTSGAVDGPFDATQLTASTWQYVFKKGVGTTFEGKNTVVVKGDDQATPVNSGTKGVHDVNSTSAIIITVDTTPATIAQVTSAETVLCDVNAAPAVACDPTPATKDVASTTPFVNVTYNEKVTITQIMFGSGSTLAAVTSQGQLSPDGKKVTYAATDLTVGTTYTLRISVKDQVAGTTNDKEFKFKVVEKAKTKISLKPGMNLISLPSNPADTGINAVMSLAEIQSVLTYDPLSPDASGSPWKSATRGADGKLGGSLATIDAQHAYWVSSTSFVDMQVVIPPVGFAATPPTIAAVAGWNLVPIVSLTGQAPDTNILADTYFASLPNWVTAYTFDPATNVWTKVTPKNFQNVVVGKGYWLYTTTAGILVP